jgi:hypothetical protein
MTTPPDDQSDKDIEALMIYDEHIDEIIGGVPPKVDPLLMRVFC